MAERGIDPRGPRFAATITTVLLAVAFVLAASGLSTSRETAGWFAYQPLADASFTPGGADGWALIGAPLLQRALDPGFVTLLVVALLFVWGVAWPRTAPWGVLYRRLVQPRLAPPSELEDPRPVRFAQGVGLAVTSIGLLLHLVGVPWALPVAAGLALIAAFLNAAFGVCLGCAMYLSMQRAGLVGRAGPSTAG